MIPTVIGPPVLRLAVSVVSDPAALIEIDMSISEWANTHPGVHPDADDFIHIDMRPDQPPG